MGRIYGPVTDSLCLLLEVWVMRKSRISEVMMALMSTVLRPALAEAQERKGAITGHVTDTTHAVVQGARVELQPSGQTAVSDGQGQFTISGLTPGSYKLTVSAVGFAPVSTGDPAVTAGGGVNVDATLQVDAGTEVGEG